MQTDWNRRRTPSLSLHGVDLKMPVLLKRKDGGEATAWHAGIQFIVLPLLESLAGYQSEKVVNLVADA